MERIAREVKGGDGGGRGGGILKVSTYKNFKVFWT